MSDYQYDEDESLFSGEGEDPQITTKDEIGYKKTKAVQSRLLAIFGIAVAIFVIVLIYNTVTKVQLEQDRAKKMWEDYEVDLSIDEDALWELETEKQIVNNSRQIRGLRTDINDTRNDIENTEKAISDKIVEIAEGIDKSILGLKDQQQKEIEKTNAKIDNLRKDTNDKIRKTQSVVQSKLEKDIQSVKKEFEKKESQTPALKDDAKLPPMLSDTRKTETQAYAREEKSEKVTKSKALDVSFTQTSTAAGGDDVELTPEQKQQEKQQRLEGEIFFPAGFAKVVLQNGIKVTTLKQGDASDYPVHFSVQGAMITAGDNEYSLQDCLLNGEATGDINSQRAKIKTRSMSCIAEIEGEQYYVQRKVNGWVYDDRDGGLGFEGKLVDSSGKVMSRELSIGLMQEFAEILSSNNVSLFGGDEGDSDDLTLTEQLQIAGSEGTSKAFEGLAEYNKKIFEAYFPWIDVKPGRVGIMYLDMDPGKEMTREFKPPKIVSKTRTEKQSLQNWENIIK